MNSVGFFADSNKLKISEPSMSFSPEGCLVWVNKEMESQAQKQYIRRRIHIHSWLDKIVGRGEREEG